MERHHDAVRQPVTAPVLDCALTFSASPSSLRRTALPEFEALRKDREQFGADILCIMRHPLKRVATRRKIMKNSTITAEAKHVTTPAKPARSIGGKETLDSILQGMIQDMPAHKMELLTIGSLLADAGVDSKHFQESLAKMRGAAH